MKRLGTIFLVIFLIGCNKTNQVNCKDNLGLFTYTHYPIGVAIDFAELNQTKEYRGIAIRDFNQITAENIFKMEYLHPEPDLFEWANADSLVKFCKANQKKLHGHTLIWHQQIPDWVLNFKGSRTEWDYLMQTYINTVVAHFKGDIVGWDVVNEAFNEDGTLRNNIWFQNMGSSYIEKAFLYAQEADPNALLFYNDYNLESNPNKRNSVIRLFDNLRKRGVKIDGIGLQSHISIAQPDIAEIATALQQFADHKYKIHISELDISVNPLGKDIEPNQQLFDQQANLLKKLIINYNQVPVQYQYGITFWGISDKNSWIRPYYNRDDYPLLFDDQYLPKPAYCALLESL